MKKLSTEQVKRGRELLAKLGKSYKQAEQFKYEIPRLPDELKYATTDREKLYLKHIYDITERLKKDFSTGLEHKEQFESVEKGEGAYIFIDGDGLKKLNDQLQDHHAGDAAIKALAKGIQAALRTRDDVQIARMGGDEFIIFIAHISLSTAVAIAKRILDNIHKQSIADNYKGDNEETKQALLNWPLTASIGVGKTKAEADKAMYKAKQSGRDRVEYHLDARASSLIIQLIKLADKLDQNKKEHLSNRVDFLIRDMFKGAK